jgi:hypothetical protein
MSKLKKILAGIGATMGAFALSLGIGLSAHAADLDTGFDATSTQSMLTTLFGNMTPTLKFGILGVLGVSLGVWVVFFLIGKLKKHTK